MPLKSCCKRSRTGAAFVLIAATISMPLWGGTVLTFDVVSHTEAAKGAKQVKGQALPADATYPLTVTLSGDTMQTDEPDGRSIYEFRKARILRLDKHKNAYEDVSLYTIVVFNGAGFGN